MDMGFSLTFKHRESSVISSALVNLEDKMAKWALVLAVAVAFFCGLAIAQEEDTITAEELGADLKKQEGMGHTFRDIIAHIYKDMKQFPGYLKFDTTHVRCRIPVGEEDDWRILDQWSRGEVDDVPAMEFKDPNLQIIWVLYHNEIQPQIVSVSGKVVEPEASGNFGFMYIFDVQKLERVKYSRER
jgi:hypothetical protein